MNYDIVIGLEIHAELKTETKAFCSCKNQFGAGINTNVCPVCFGLPGALPTINKTALMYTIKAGLAFNSQINTIAIFERKNYFYPDLSKSYQISQLEKPVCVGGFVRYKLNGQEKHTNLDNIHMEEDAGKSIHDEKSQISLIDFNRCGVPLIEIVTKPDMHSIEEAVATLESIKEVLETIGVSDCKMQEGSLRCDVNISLKPAGAEKLGTRTEMKNLNSFKAVARAIEYEVNRQTQIINSGKKVVQETLKWNDETLKNHSLRNKENSNDYRYFPDPDLLSVAIVEDYVNEIKASLPELPFNKRERFINELKLPEHDTGILTSNSSACKFFEDCLMLYNNPKALSNWIMTDVMRKMKEDLIDNTKIEITCENFVNLIKLVENKCVTINSAKVIFENMWKTNLSADEIVKKLGLSQDNDEQSVTEFVKAVLKENTQAVLDYKNGNDRTFTFLVGQVMKNSKGKANPQIVNKILKEELKK